MAKKQSSDLVANLAKMPPGKKAAVLGGVLAVMALLYWQFFYSGLTEAKDSETKKRSRLVKEQTDLDKQMKELKALQAERKKLEEGMAGIQMSLPTEAELPSFIDHLQVKAGDAGVNFKSWDRGAEVPIDKYIKVPLGIEVTGTFYQVMHFFHLLGPRSQEKDRGIDEEDDVSKVGRIVTIEGLRIGEAVVKNDEIILTARFVASTFRQEAAVAPPAPKKAAAAKKGGVRDSTKKRENAVENKTKEGAGDKGSKRLTKPGAELSPK